MEHTVPLYEPDVGLLFGGEENGDAVYSALSASWSAVLHEDSQLPAEDERIAFSKPVMRSILMIAWLGQSCSYVQIRNSLNVLTDPIFGYPQGRQN